MLESYKDAGGMLAWAIPAFRLPRNVLRRDIAYIEQMGVRIRTGVSFGRDETLADLREKGARAVIIATGTQKGVSMNIHGENGLWGTFDCLTFLRKINDREPLNVGNRILVVGGGNAAVDTARSALRVGAQKVTLLYRRTLEEMPAHRDEVTEALREGVEILFLTAPVGILATGGKVTGLECVGTELGEPDASGRRRPLPVEGSRFEIPADTVISAVGQQPDYEAVSRGLPLEDKPVVIDPETMLTPLEGVFAAGDFLHGPTTVVEAMASGRKAARAVDAYLSRDGH
jgi:NADPH-dependent glutamate synthase beta subunit-like oxidoreductase